MSHPWQLQGSFQIPPHNKEIVDETDPNNVTIKYFRTNTLLATKTVVVSGAISTITMVYENV